MDNKTTLVIFEQHHWIITFGMFIGELVSIFFYIYILIKRKFQDSLNKDKPLLDGNNNQDEEKNEEQEAKEENNKENEPDEKKKPIPTNFIFFITAGCDLLATTINTFGLTYLSTSVFQMMRGLELFFVCLWSKIFLKNHIYRHAILGIGSLVFGLFLVGLNSLIR